jgi:hypothetical protein
MKRAACAGRSRKQRKGDVDFSLHGTAGCLKNLPAGFAHFGGEFGDEISLSRAE